MAFQILQTYIQVFRLQHFLQIERTGHNFPRRCMLPFLHLHPAFNCGQCTLLKVWASNQSLLITSWPLLPILPLWEMPVWENSAPSYICFVFFSSYIHPTFLYLYHTVLCQGDGCCKRFIPLPSCLIYFSLSFVDFLYFSEPRWTLRANQVVTSRSTWPVSPAMLELLDSSSPDPLSCSR